MNQRKEWQKILALANAELTEKGYSIEINDNEEEGFFKCVILKNGKAVKTYAENYYENELDELVTEVWNYVKSNLDKIGKRQKKAYLLTFHATTRIVVDSANDPLEDDNLFSKCVAMARERMLNFGIDEYLCGDNAEINEDTEMPYDKDYDKDMEAFFVKD